MFAGRSRPPRLSEKLRHSAVPCFKYASPSSAFFFTIFLILSFFHKTLTKDNLLYQNIQANYLIYFTFKSFNFVLIIIIVVLCPIFNSYAMNQCFYTNFLVGENLFTEYLSDLAKVNNLITLFIFYLNLEFSWFLF